MFLSHISISLTHQSLSLKKKKKKSALTGVAQWIEHQTAKQRVTGSIPSQGTCLGCRPGPQEGVHERQPHIHISLPLFLSPFPSI